MISVSFKEISGIQAVLYVLENDSIKSAKYQEINAVGRTIAAEDLKHLVDLGILIKLGEKGRGIKYLIETNDRAMAAN